MTETPTDETPTELRTAVRVLPIDGDGRVLLLHGFDPARPAEPYWFTVGGGLEPGETPAEAAVRELAEEVGLAATPDRLVGPLAEATIEFWFDSVRYLQQQTYYAVRVAPDPITFAGQDAIEHASIDAYAWFSAAELAGTTDPVYPDDLADLLARAVAALA
ncbi:NUDIX hydrolase [Microlunatus parietis]|uniref:8-oxo-dGTP pyrophosphatase MutT (NUDIX family) n=1 Tax=Microlunatus parietis TaxID=682979 RepID=A0A7Y9LCI4_9ACTN|nr:NUDIX domain-containing protein [Microlunatus parietis]NYE70951.1 8-oxo-dGTP pyrophosphatase MutT (NUDIX family) [Microlunatus parietis]